MDTFAELESHLHLTAEAFFAKGESLLSKWKCVKEAKSVEGRPIRLYKRGYGPIRVLIWTQMHGNESTASYAFLDFCQTLENNPKLAETLFASLSIYTIPILNPDGAAIYSRYNALGVDINRDARTAVSPESTFLLAAAKGIKPHWAFNMHDQRNIFAVGDTKKPATIALLAPSFADDYTGSILHRQRAIALIGKLVSDCSEEERMYTARFSDTFYPLAMGDYFQEMGIATILVETGGSFNDIHRTKGRERTAALIKNAMLSIANPQDSMLVQYPSFYNELKENHVDLSDLIFFNVGVQSYRLDVAFNMVYDATRRHFMYVLSAVGKFTPNEAYYSIDMGKIPATSIDVFSWVPGSQFLVQDLPKDWQESLKHKHPTLWNLSV